MKIKKIFAMMMVAMLLLASLTLPAMAAVNPTIETGTPTYSLGKYYFSNLTVTGTGIRTINISFSDNVTTGDQITLPGTTDHFTVSGTSNLYSKRISIDSGVPISDIQNYLRGVGYTIASTSQTVSITVANENDIPDTYFNADTQHYYQYISDTSSSWTTAYTAAKGMSYMGREGYLATITSKAEDTFLNEVSGGKNGWLGGTILFHSIAKVNAYSEETLTGQYYSSINTNSITTGGWYWACGPEIGTIFYSVNTLQTEPSGPTSGGAATGDAKNPDTYYNWARGTESYEPNNLTHVVDPEDEEFETCLTTLTISDNTGKQGTSFSWNDKQYNTAGDGEWDAQGYFVEYGNQLVGDIGSVAYGFGSDSAELSKAPKLTAGTVLRTSDTAGTIKFISDRAGVYYYAVVADGAAEPAIDTSGAGITCVAGENVITDPVGLTAGAKDIYIKVKDAQENFSAALKMDITVARDVALPATGDDTTTVPFMVLGICSLLIAILLGKKRQTI